MKQRVTHYPFLILLGFISSLLTQTTIAQSTLAILPNSSSLNDEKTIPPVGSQLSFRLIEPEVICSYAPFQIPLMFTFRTSGRDTSAIWYKAIGITGWTKSSGPHIINPACDVQPFTLQAYQESHPNDIVTYTWDYKARCPTNCSSEPTTPSTSAITLLAPNYNCSTGEFTFRATGGDGSQVSYRAIGVTDWTNSPGPFIVKPACDVQPFQLMVRQASRLGQITYRYWDYLAYCSQNCQGSDSVAVITSCDKGHVLNGKPLSVSATFTCNTVSPNLIHVTFSGGVVDPNSMLEWYSIGITPWTQVCSGIADIANTDNRTFVLQARQRNIYTGVISATAQTTVTQPCPARDTAGRLGQAIENSLTVHVLGNPTLADVIDVEIEGGTGEQLQILVSDTQGALISQQVIEQVALSRRVSVPLGKASGLYFLKVVTPFQQKIVKLIRQ